MWGGRILEVARGKEMRARSSSSSQPWHKIVGVLQSVDWDLGSATTLYLDQQVSLKVRKS